MNMTLQIGIRWIMVAAPCSRGAKGWEGAQLHTAAAARCGVNMSGEGTLMPHLATPGSDASSSSGLPQWVHHSMHSRHLHTSRGFIIDKGALTMGLWASQIWSVLVLEMALGGGRDARISDWTTGYKEEVATAWRARVRKEGGTPWNVLMWNSTWGTCGRMCEGNVGGREGGWSALVVGLKNEVAIEGPVHDLASSLPEQLP